ASSSCICAMSDKVTRVGLTAKRGLDAAADVLADLAKWLDARGAAAVFDAETAKLAGVPTGRATVSRDDLPSHCDLVVVLGGDGTLIGMAGGGAPGRRGAPRPGGELRTPRL